MFDQMLKLQTFIKCTPLKTNGWMPQNDDLEDVSPDLNLAIFGIYVKFLGCSFPPSPSSKSHQFFRMLFCWFLSGRQVSKVVSNRPVEDTREQPTFTNRYSLENERMSPENQWLVQMYSLVK